MDDRVARIARHVKYFKFWLTSDGLFGQRATVHSRHNDVGQEQIDSLMARKYVKRRFTIGGLYDIVTHLLQRLCDEGAHIDIIFRNNTRSPCPRGKGSGAVSSTFD
jgi:hypothetical protein